MRSERNSGSERKSQKKCYEHLFLFFEGLGITLHYITLHYITLHYIILHYIISYHIISYHIISYHIISYHIISYHMRAISCCFLAEASFS